MTLFQARHYRALAKCISQVNDDVTLKWWVASFLSNMLEKDNEKFDRKRFIAASVDGGELNVFDLEEVEKLAASSGYTRSK